MEFDEQVLLLKSIIQSQQATLPYTSFNFSLIHKRLAYQSFLNLLDGQPIQLAAHFFCPKSKTGLQSRLFQEYVRLLELSLPFSFIKNKQVYRIQSLLDQQLNIFHGISQFQGTINSKLEIKNGTQEYYIGGRTGSYTSPYFLGKILSITDLSHNSFLHLMKSFTFSKIQMQNVQPNTQVIVTHLSIPPHYQMGGMSYLNRARKKIAEELASQTNLVVV